MTAPKHESGVNTLLLVLEGMRDLDAQDALIVRAATDYSRERAEQMKASKARRLWLASFGMRGEERVEFWS